MNLSILSKSMRKEVEILTNDDDFQKKIGEDETLDLLIDRERLIDLRIEIMEKKRKEVSKEIDNRLWEIVLDVLLEKGKITEEAKMQVMNRSDK